jgi:hypothetical protein
MEEVFNYKKNEKLPDWIATGNAHFGADAKVIKKGNGEVVVEGSWGNESYLICFGENARQTCKSIHAINTNLQAPNTKLRQKY